MRKIEFQMLKERYMKLYANKSDYKLYHGNMLDMNQVIENESIDAIVCDPPYELNFMSKSWDNSGIAFQPNTWKQCFNALKEGGYLLAFGGSRTYHRIACAIEDAGFEIRDCLMWLYGSGFPKSMNIGLAIDKKNGVESKVVGKGKSGNTSKAFNLNDQQREAGTGVLAGDYEIKQATNEWNGWGTCLKPAYEPIIVARKPFKGSLVDNVLKNGVGGLNIDGCRVGETGGVKKKNIEPNSGSKNCGFGCNGGREDLGKGRFPANVMLDDTFTEDWSRYFYCAKVSKKDRDEGLDEFEEAKTTDGCIRSNQETARKFGANSALRKNIHPTVKPTQLMQYLVRLVAPNGATILDPFMGSGSTGKAVMIENQERNTDYKFIGVEMTDEYLPICEARIDLYAKKDSTYTIDDYVNEMLK